VGNGKWVLVGKKDVCRNNNPNFVYRGVSQPAKAAVILFSNTVKNVLRL
jgi:hypothetical protein